MVGRGRVGDGGEEEGEREKEGGGGEEGGGGKGGSGGGGGRGREEWRASLRVLYPKVMATKNEVKSESYVSHRMSFDVSHQRSE